MTFPYTLTETIYKVGGVAHKTSTAIAISHNRIEAASGADWIRVLNYSANAMTAFR